MTTRWWIKLYVEILDDPKMGLMSDRLWRRTVELFLMAGETKADGMLPSLRDMAWRLRPISEEELESDLVELGNRGILKQLDGRWWVANFAERQRAEGTAERSRHYRSKRQKDGMGGGATPDTAVRDACATKRDIDLELELDLEQEEKTNQPAGGILTELVRLGLSPKKAKELSAKYPASVVSERARQYVYALGAKIARSPGYLYRACLEDWPPPQGYAPDPDSEAQRLRYVSGEFGEFVQR